MPDDPDNELLLQHIDLYHAWELAMAISAWAGLEYEIDELLWELARLEPNQGACLTAQFSNVNSRFNALLALCRLENVSPKLIMELNAFKVKALAMADVRNRLVHDPWGSTYQSGKHYRLQKTARAKLDYSYKHVSEEDMKEIRTKIDGLIEEFRSIRAEILHAFWTSP